MKCLLHEDVVLYRHGKLPFLKKIFCCLHIKKCKTCAAVLEDIYKEDELIAEMQNSIRIFENLQKKCSE